MLFTLTWIPLLAAIALLFIPKRRISFLRNFTIGSLALPFLITLCFFISFDRSQAGFQFVSSISWLPQLGIHYSVGVDGINLTLCLLHALVSFAGSFAAARTVENLKLYLFFYLILCGAIYGIFTTLDIFFLYVFYEMTLIPLYPMIAIWGSKNKEYGAMKLTLFITTGAVLALVGLIALYKNLGISSFDIQTLTAAAQQNAIAWDVQVWLAPLIIVGFGVMASLWPIHSWSPIGYAAAPTSVSMLHAGVLKKMGPYFILRVAVGMLPQGTREWGHVLALLAGIGILYAGYAAIKQRDLKFMVGFSSVSHMGYILLGIASMTTVGISGTVLLMFSHGVMAACTFALIGHIYEQSHVRGIYDFGGIGKQLPFVGICFIMASFASLGLPGFSNFAAELLVFIGSWSQYPVIVGIAIFGILITALYLLRAVQNVCYGEVNPKWQDLKDATTLYEKFPFILLLGVLLLFGFWPQGLLGIIRPAVQALLAVSS